MFVRSPNFERDKEGLIITLPSTRPQLLALIFRFYC
jgi:hypothetical protein